MVIHRHYDVMVKVTDRSDETPHRTCKSLRGRLSQVSRAYSILLYNI